MDTIDRAERLTNLLALLLSTRRALTAEDVFNELTGQYPAGPAAKRQAFERDKASLRDIGVPIETEVLGGSDAGRTAYRIDRDRYELHDLELTGDETRALQAAVAAIRSGTPLGTDALLKLGAGAPDGDAAVWANIPTLEALPVLREAVSARTSVTFGYHGRSRHVDPWGMLLRDGFWYVVGFDHGHGERRTFRVDRIEGAVAAEAGTSFDRPELDLRSVLPNDPKQLGAGGEAQDGATAVVRLDLASNRVGDALHELGEARILDRRNDGWVDVLVPCANAAAFRSWVLGFLDAAMVVEPPSVRVGIVGWLDAPGEIDIAVVKSALRQRGVPAGKVAGGMGGRRRADVRVRRMLLILPWLIERGEVPLDEVAQRFDLSPEEVESDIAWVSMCGLPPYVDEMIDVFVDEGMVYMGVPRVFTRPLRLTAPEG
ncbi:MAG: WYL domain-containing protein, partial [Actinomycetota bacterium]|nr:WYL domain-containing protein [Actinomycetota bacterium]